ncbi:hypothetical protein WISP_79152 [Willisornis vidua]|uniref:Uncharacterized protein n=1 Tax=Willisornis vidua TaxID=1566151 RepID=A0ABQ9D810_9PASS|nr:hypothetical protein WISP_79152 [Willisornis vidua]
MTELVEELAKLLSIIYHQSWLTGEVPDNWKLVNMIHTHKKGWKEDLGHHRPVSLTVLADSYGTDHLECDHMVPTGQLGNQTSQHGFRRGGSCLTNLIFYDQETHLVEEGKAVDVVFDTISHGIPLEKLAAHGQVQLVG